MIEETNPEKAPSPEAQQVDQEQVLSDVETVTVETNCQQSETSPAEKSSETKKSSNQNRYSANFKNGETLPSCHNWKLCHVVKPGAINIFTFQFLTAPIREYDCASDVSLINDLLEFFCQIYVAISVYGLCDSKRKFYYRNNRREFNKIFFYCPKFKTILILGQKFFFNGTRIFCFYSKNVLFDSHNPYTVVVLFV